MLLALLGAVALALFILPRGGSGCQIRFGGPQTQGAGGFLPIAASGPESWMVDGNQRQITATYYLDLPDGFQFTIEIPVDDVPMVYSAALERAWPVIRYVFAQDIYLRTSIAGSRGVPREVTRIGVVLFRQDGARAKGMRTGMSLSEIRARLVDEYRRGGK